MPYQILVGGSCYTSSEEQKLLNHINEKSHGNISRVNGHWLYYVHLSEESTLDKVEQLLQVTDNPQLPLSSHKESCIELHITPRRISPWSTQATGIAHVCGLKVRVHRIERGRSILIECEETYNGHRDLAFRDVIYDRMTEDLNFEPPDLDEMFAEGARKPLEIIDILANGRDPLAALGEYNRNLGLGLVQSNLEYLVAEFKKLGRSPVRPCSGYACCHDQSQSCYVFPTNYLLLLFSVLPQPSYPALLVRQH